MALSPMRMFGRRAGAFGMALSAYDVWRRLPPEQRKLLVDNAKVHGPRLAAVAVAKARDRLPRTTPPKAKP